MADNQQPTRGRHSKQSGKRRAARPGWARLLLCALLPALLVLGGCFGGAAPEPPASEATATIATTASPAADATAGDAAGTPGNTDAAAPAPPATEPVAGATAAAAPNATPGPAAAPAGEPPLALAPPGAVLDSYQMYALYVITSTFADGSQRVDRTAVAGTWRRTDGAQFPFDAQLVVDNQRGDQQQQLALVVLGPDAAIRSDGQWATVARDANLPYADPDTVLSLPFVTRVNHGDTVGREPVDGTETTHYRITDPAVFADVMAGAISPGSGQVQSVRLEGWVADAGYVAKYTLEAQFSGATTLDAQGNRAVADQAISAGYALSDIDRAPPITWPEDAQPPGTTDVPGFAPNTFPVPEGAQLHPKLGLLEIVSSEDPDTVTAFYRDRLATLGWAMAGEFGFYTLTKDGKTLTLTILPDEAAGLTVVRVFAP